jgi:hypothetical protein
MKYVYIALCVAGTAVTFYFFVPFVLEHGLNLSVFLHQLMATPVSAFFGADVVMSSIALWALIAYERRKRRCGSGGCASSPTWRVVNADSAVLDIGTGSVIRVSRKSG